MKVFNIKQYTDVDRDIGFVYISSYQKKGRKGSVPFLIKLELELDAKN